MREDEVLGQVVEPACNPFHKQGQWLRLLRIKVNDPQGGSGEDNIDLIALEEHSYCKRHCATLEAACWDVHDSEAADAIPALLMKNTKSVDQIQDHVCKPFCSSAAVKKAWKTQIPEKLLQAIRDEATETIPSKELEMESLMDSIEQQRVPGVPRMDVYSREEMLDMRTAIEEGDRERLVELDTSADHLSDKDLDYLRGLYSKGTFEHDEEAQPEDGAQYDPHQSSPPTQGNSAAHEKDSGASLFTRLWSSMFG
jgi:hypothetical protein